MDNRGFDALTRRAAGALHRRAVFGVLTGAVLAAMSPSHPALADKGGKDTREKKRCRKQARVCLSAVIAYCHDAFGVDTVLSVICLGALLPCCRHYKQCKEGKGDACLARREPPPCCANDGDICCGGGSSVTCCPASFPHCPPAGSPAICCPADAPIVCPNGSCTRQGYTCCSNNPGSCEPGKTCCPTGCASGGTC